MSDQEIVWICPRIPPQPVSQASCGVLRLLRVELPERRLARETLRPNRIGRRTRAHASRVRGALVEVIDVVLQLRIPDDWLRQDLACVCGNAARTAVVDEQTVMAYMVGVDALDGQVVDGRLARPSEEPAVLRDVAVGRAEQVASVDGVGTLPRAIGPCPDGPRRG